MTQHADGSDRTVGDYSHLARRRWKAIVVGVVIGVLLAVAYLIYATPTYVSTAKVLVNSVSADAGAPGSSNLADVNLDTEAQLVTSLPVATRAAEILGGARTPVQLATLVTVSVPPNTTVLTISFSGTSGKEAQAGAEAFARAYVASRDATAQDAINLETERLERNSDQLGQQLTTIRKQLNDTTNPSSRTDRAALLARREIVNAQLSAVSGNLSSLRGTLVHRGSIIFDAQVPSTKASPNPFLILPSGVMAGVLLGLGLAVFRDKYDKRIRRAADVERLFGLPVLAMADATRTSNLERSPSVQHEMRALHHALVAPNPNVSVVTLMVGTGSSGANQLAEVLSNSSARSGSRTTLVRNQSRANIARSDEMRPLLNLELLDYKSLEIIVDDELRLYTLSTVIDDLRKHRDLIVLEMPTNDWALDLTGLGPSVDVVVVVVELGRASRRVIHKILEYVGRTTAREVVAVALRQSKGAP